MMITEEIKVSDEIFPSGGYADVRTGTCKGRLVAVKTMRIAEQDDLLKIRKVSVDDISLGYLECGSDRPSPEILQRSYPLECGHRSEHLETRWDLGGHE